MTALPRTLRHDGVELAYQVTGEGPPLLFVNGWFTDIVAQWRMPRLTTFLQRLGASASVISFDERGMGRSSRVPDDRLPDLDTKVGDIVAVLDALGTERVSVLGTSEGGPLAVAFTAAHPDRVDALVLDGAKARYGAPLPDYPFGYGQDELDPYAAWYVEGWGTRTFAEEFYAWVAPSAAGDPAEIAAYVELMRASGEPATVGAMTRHVYATTDVRDRLPTIACPTLVRTRTGDQVVPAAEVRWMSARLPGAIAEVSEGEDHPIWADDPVAAADRVVAFVRDGR